MGENFTNIIFKKHRLNEKGLHGIYRIDDNQYVSICTGGDSYGKLYRVEYELFLAQLHGRWFKNIKSTFEVGLVTDDSHLQASILSDLNQQDVEDYIKKIKQTYSLG